jgi:hypothetical protein
MPRSKDLKRLVRARMRKTGEAYTAARSHLIKQPIAASFAPVDHAALAGMSDDKVKAKTGWTWERWTRTLDKLGADTKSHREIAKLVSEKVDVGSWWTQTVTVGYERIKGLRARGQQRNGTHQMTKSRTYEVPVTTLFDAWSNARTRRRWLSEDGVRIRMSRAPKSMRLDWPDNGIVAVGFIAKGSGKSSVAIEHTKLPDRESAVRLKAEWGRRFDRLGEILERA